jgi:hypothetical protein
VSLSPDELRELRDPHVVSVRLSLALKAFNFGTTAGHAAARQGELTPGVKVLKIGRCYRVPAAALRRALQIETENDESA